MTDTQHLPDEVKYDGSCHGSLLPQKETDPGGRRQGFEESSRVDKDVI